MDDDSVFDDSILNDEEGSEFEEPAPVSNPTYHVNRAIY